MFIKLFYITGIFTHFLIVFCVLFLGFSLFHVWLFGMFGNITFRFFLHKHIKTPNHQEAIRSCSRCEFFTSDFINACEDIQSLITRLTIYHYSISKLKYQNLDLFSHLLLLLSGNISLNTGPIHQNTMQCSNEWNVFKIRDLHFLHLNINSLLSKIEELRDIAKITNAAVIGICESKLDAFSAVLNDNINKTDSVNNEIDILGDFNIF